MFPNLSKILVNNFNNESINALINNNIINSKIIICLNNIISFIIYFNLIIIFILRDKILLNLYDNLHNS